MVVAKRVFDRSCAAKSKCRWRRTFEQSQDCRGDNSRVRCFVDRGPAPDEMRGFTPTVLASGEAVRRILLRDPMEAEQPRYAAYAQKYALAALWRVLPNSNEFLFVE